MRRFEALGVPVLGGMIAVVLLGACGAGDLQLGESATHNSASENGAIHQEVIDCCQRIHTIAQYQDHRSNYQVGHCMNEGQRSVRRGPEAFAEWKANNCQSDPSLVNGGSSSGGSTGGTTIIVEDTYETTPTGASLSGTLYAMGTTPLQALVGATVVVSRVDATGTVVVASTTTDEQGRYSLSGLLPNAYIVELAGAQLEATALEHVEVTTNDAIVLDVQARPTLSLTAVCSNVSGTKLWRVDNPVSGSVLFWWELYGSDHRGALTAPPGSSYFTTPAVAGANVVRVLVGNRAIDSQSNTDSSCAIDGNAASGVSAGPPPASLDGSCIGLRPGCGNQVCYQATDSGRCTEIRYDCCCLETYGDVDMWEPGTCNPN
jgi:hypothetical protein